MTQTKMNNSGTLGAPPTGVKLQKYMLIDNKVYQIHTIIAHRFRMGDVEDPDIYAAQPLWEWQQTEMGKWIMDKAMDTPEWHRQHDQFNYGFQYAITAKLKGPDYTFWQLKWGNEVDRQGVVTV